MLFAYLDPFTGSMVLQVLAAGFVTILAFFRPLYNFIFGKKTTQNQVDDWNENVSADENSEEKSDEKSEDGAANE